MAHNDADVAETEQEFVLGPHAIFVIAESGRDSDIRRSVENHRGMGVGSMTVIRGGTPDDSALDTVTNGSIVWNGTQYDGLDLSSATDADAKAAALQALIRRGSGTRVRAGRGRPVFRHVPVAPEPRARVCGHHGVRRSSRISVWTPRPPTIRPDRSCGRATVS